MTEANFGSPPPAHHPPRHGGTVVFWLLVLLAFGTFTPCVILPEWRAYQTLDLARQAEEHRLQQVQRAVDRERRQLEAMRTDPAVIDRLAQRDLRFRRIGDRTVRVAAAADYAPVSLVAFDEHSAEPFIPQPAAPPPLVTNFASHLPAYDYDRVFCDRETRPVVMCMSVGLLVVALGLFCVPRTPGGPSL